ncbi:MAG TPA: xanthine dehydrogenase family protein molybdopterin-binding subunit [Pseudomonadales bacterium]|nr:xanthine dehydrogenase family protein molybdopterin-binding subunit [Pseudomonadales bacterium]
MSEQSTPKTYRSIGTSPVRPDGIDKVTGRANYGADRHLPGMLHGKTLRSPHAHARIRSIDVSEAEKLPGVMAVVTGADFPHLKSAMEEAGESQIDVWDLARNVMARDKVLYHGHAVAAVAATSDAIAEAALAKIRVDYEVLTPVMDIEAAMADNAPLLHEEMRTQGLPAAADRASNVATVIKLARGDLAAGFAAADVVIEREFSTPTVHQGYIEPHAVVADCRENGQATLWCCTQGPFVVRTLTSKVLNWDVSRIKVIPSEIGGGFGAKTTVYQEPVAIMLSLKSGRPVKMVMNREEVFRATGPTSASRIRIKLGANRAGKIMAAEAELKYEAGAFKGSPVMPGCMCVFVSYEMQSFSITGYDVVVNKPKVAAYRAPGAPMAAFAMESMIDEMAHKLAIDPIQFRLDNAVREGSQAVYGPKFPAIGFEACLKQAESHPHYRAPLGANQGRGVAAGFWFNVGMQSSATVNVQEDGSAIVITASPDIGGSRASMALMASEELGIPYERINALVGDTETAGYCDVTGGSRTTFATGMAVIQASKDVIRQMRERAAKVWNVEIDQVSWVDGAAVPAAEVAAEKDLKPLSFAELARNAAHTGGPIAGRASLMAQGAGAGFGVHLCDVEVDPETGKVDIIRYTVIQDAGKAIHPAYVEGQLQGGAVQGIGWALNEEYVYNAQGVMENPAFLDYRMPVALDLPMIDAVIVEVPNPSHPYGVRGVGETPIVPPLGAVANAVHDATQVRFCHLPLNPPRVLAGLQAAGA